MACCHREIVLGDEGYPGISHVFGLEPTNTWIVWGICDGFDDGEAVDYVGKASELMKANSIRWLYFLTGQFPLANHHLHLVVLGKLKETLGFKICGIAAPSPLDTADSSIREKQSA